MLPLWFHTPKNVSRLVLPRGTVINFFIQVFCGPNVSLFRISKEKRDNFAGLSVYFSSACMSLFSILYGARPVVDKYRKKRDRSQENGIPCFIHILAMVSMLD